MLFKFQMRPGLAPVLLVILSLQPFDILAHDWTPDRLLQFSQQACNAWVSFTDNNLEAAEKSDIKFRDRVIGTKYSLELESNAFAELDVIHPAGRASRFVSRLFDELENPLVLLSLDAECRLQRGRSVTYNDRRQMMSIVSLDQDLAVRGEPDWINRPLQLIADKMDETSGKKNTLPPVRVGMVDSGVNYTLADINRRLARDSSNRLIGYDFWDMDALPYDAHPLSSGFMVQRHGTRTASVLLDEASTIELVPYRYPRPDMTRMKALVEHARDNHVSIIGMPLGSNSKEEWRPFEQVARANPQMLFIVSAGNDNRNIDKQPVYPAALELDNMLVVTSADDFVRLAERSNWGRKSVDYLVPAEGVDAIDFSGDRVRVSGSSYAVSRLTALAARIKALHRDWDAKQIIDEIQSRYSIDEGRVLNWVRSGYIADPRAGDTIKKIQLAPLNISRADINDGLKLSLEILSLDPGWTGEIIQQALQQAYDILAQCEIYLGKISLHAIQGPDYLRDLSTGSAHSLLSVVDRSRPAIVFARDTGMQTEYLGEAFGIGNTRNRPWLANSVWLMLGVGDNGISLAHELYHVLANNGDHFEGIDNLMQADSRPENVKLTEDQCRLARENGINNKLLHN